MLIFDKSVLQALSPDESVWLESLYLTNITPMFFIETLADLEKEVRKGRTPEQIVGGIARKTPDMSSYPNVHHRRILAAELAGIESVEMEGRPILGGGQAVEMAGKTGVMFKVAPETEAFHRWQKGEFLDLERHAAREWRKALAELDFQDIAQIVSRWFALKGRPRTLEEARALATDVAGQPTRESVLLFGLGLLAIPQDLQDIAIRRWREAGQPALETLFPYFMYTMQVDLVFYIGIAAGLISGERKSNRIDLAYLYYLPFCLVFVSGDHLHGKLVPLFLRADQSFVELGEFKRDLAALDHHFDQLPDDVKRRGTIHFASYPPTDTSFLVTRLWDKHLPRWRKHESERGKEESVPEHVTEGIRKLVEEFKNEAKPTSRHVDSDQSQVMFERRASMYKGKWRRFPPEVEEAERTKREG